MLKAYGTIGAYLDGVLVANKEVLGRKTWPKIGEVFGDTGGMIEAAFADMATDSGERNNNDGGWEVVGK